MLKRARGLVSAPQPFPQHIHLAGTGPRSPGLARSDFDKGPAHRGEELRITRSLKYLDQKRAVRFQMAPREFQRQFTQMDAAGLVGRAHPAQIGGHVRNYKVEPSPLQGGLDPFEHFLVAEISADDSNPGYRRNFQKIDRDDASGPPDALRDRLRPSPRRSPEIDHGVPGMRELVPLRDFDQLVRRARAVTVRLCAVNVGIADVAPEPSLAGFAAGHSLDFLNARIITRPPMNLRSSFHQPKRPSFSMLLMRQIEKKESPPRNFSIGSGSTADVDVSRTDQAARSAADREGRRMVGRKPACRPWCHTQRSQSRT